MKNTVFAIALAVASVPFTFAAQQPAANPPANAPAAQTSTSKSTTTKVRKHVKKNKPAPAVNNSTASK
jgi:hypothetical protein